MKTNYFKFKIDKDKYPFFQWTKLRKLTLYAGIVVLLFVMMVTIYYFIYEKNLYSQRLRNIPDDVLLQMQKNQLLPTLLARFWRRTLTFTWLSNLFVGLALILFAIYPRNWIAQRAVFLSVVYITITFFVFWGLIFPASIKEFNLLGFFMTSVVHLINPVIGMVFFVLARKNIKVTEATIWLSSVVLLAYYLFALISYFAGDSMVQELKARNLEGNLYQELDLVIYTFLDFKKPLFLTPSRTYVTVFVNIGIVFVGLLIPPLLGMFWQKVCKIKSDTITKAYDIK